MKPERIGPHEILETETTFSFRMAPGQWWFLMILILMIAIVGGAMAYIQMFVNKEPLRGNKQILAPLMLVLSPILLVFMVWYIAQGNDWTVIDRSANEYRKKDKVYSTADALKFVAIENMGKSSWLVGLSDGNALVGNKRGFRNEPDATAFKSRVDAFLAKGRAQPLT